MPPRTAAERWWLYARDGRSTSPSSRCREHPPVSTERERATRATPAHLTAGIAVPELETHADPNRPGRDLGSATLGQRCEHATVPPRHQGRDQASLQLELPETPPAVPEAMRVLTRTRLVTIRSDLAKAVAVGAIVLPPGMPVYGLPSSNPSGASLSASKTLVKPSRRVKKAIMAHLPDIGWSTTCWLPTESPPAWADVSSGGAHYGAYQNAPGRPRRNQ